MKNIIERANEPASCPVSVGPLALPHAGWLTILKLTRRGAGDTTPCRMSRVTLHSYVCLELPREALPPEGGWCSQIRHLWNGTEPGRTNLVRPHRVKARSNFGGRVQGFLDDKAPQITVYTYVRCVERRFRPAHLRLSLRASNVKTVQGYLADKRYSSLRTLQ